MLEHVKSSTRIGVFELFLIIGKAMVQNRVNGLLSMGCAAYRQAGSIFLYGIKENQRCFEI